MSQIIGDTLAKIKTDSARPLVFASVKSRVSVLKDPGQVFFTDTNACIFNAEYSGLRHVDAHIAFRCVFNRIGNDLFNDE